MEKLAKPSETGFGRDPSPSGYMGKKIAEVDG
jgi:hypothetical protein